MPCHLHKKRVKKIHEFCVEGQMILTAIALMLAAQDPSVQSMLVPTDGKKHKLRHNGETFEVRNYGDKITVYRIPTFFGRK